LRGTRESGDPSSETTCVRLPILSALGIPFQTVRTQVEFRFGKGEIWNGKVIYTAKFVRTKSIFGARTASRAKNFGCVNWPLVREFCFGSIPLFTLPRGVARTPIRVWMIHFQDRRGAALLWARAIKDLSVLYGSCSRPIFFNVY